MRRVRGILLDRRTLLLFFDHSAPAGVSICFDPVCDVLGQKGGPRPSSTGQLFFRTETGQRSRRLRLVQSPQGLIFDESGQHEVGWTAISGLKKEAPI